MLKCSTQIMIIVVVAGLSSTAVVVAERPVSRNSRETLAQVLRLEVDGGVANRAELLQGVLGNSKRDAPARWQSGQVRTHAGWVAYDQQPTSDKLLALRSEYRQRRSDAGESFEERLKLADWCRTHRLWDQERAHLVEALEIQPTSEAVRRRLGYRMIGGIWLSPQQIEMFKEEQQTRAAALNRWQPRILKIRTGLSSPSERRRHKAEKELAAITDPEAVYAMEQMFFRGQEPEELAATRTFGQMTVYQAAHALVDVAIAANNSRVRDAAIEELQNKPHKQSVPELLGRLTTPIETDIEASYRNGSAFIRQVYYREQQYQKRALVVESTIDYIGPTDLNTASSRRLAEDISRRQKETTRQINAQAQKDNARIYTVLAAISEVDVSNSPQKWWAWWNSEQDTEVGEKPVDLSYNQNYFSFDQSYKQYTPTAECFQASTPVWTDEGFVAIEKIRAGDRVLSKNIETGELMYKPVLRPTQRTPQELKTILLQGGESLVCTGGHPFWHSGHGWTMAKNLAAGNVLHTVIGSQKVAAISGGAAEKVYNLVVADFHTYFVGRGMVLSHDNAIREPTNAIVPGLMREELTAR
ncbi:polymorphic toxin-type HINT domain-containing protein [Symmachiella dynata]|uniref:polymorphic toxin-type HINT domain-containing protein n=1 Tax=Symmachiella dynata TaxID=2527995 RepID=UPI0018D35D3C|nr:polymorphic toxin-type HINT domain-containing protein [Symmachiella dynata]